MNNSIRFIIFICVTISLYSLMNYYFIKKHQNVMTLRSLPAILFRLVLFTVILTPVATVVFTMKELPFWAAVTGFTGYSWLAFLFLFLVIHGTVDIILFAAEKIGLAPSKYINRAVFTATLVISISVLAYGFHEAKTIRVERHTIPTKKLKAGHDTVKIVQISDVHFSPIISTAAAENICRLTAEENPDIIVSTGDLLDRAIRNSSDVVSMMRTISAPLGKFAVTGNHEFYSGLEYSERFTDAAGFRLLRNESVTLPAGVTLAGVDDPSGRHNGIVPEKSESEVLSACDPKNYTILLKHQPRIIEENTKFYDLQLSGHTHGGQIFPFTALVRAAFPYLCGLYTIDEGTKIYVSRGTGTWGPPIRVLSPPEITVIELVHEE
ncbi:MAG TPA: metallophosphoesterase [Spirochaetota bacterium]|nr:metallophosphoesterase [Spirochaetota bacterium]HPI89295.1 metallophosphoesterase [Spirochaetota bacterium]HPR48532.1 metallophosphoesterase [Spirochaetota bacterium]